MIYSLPFIIFIMICLVFYYIIPAKWQWILLLTASYMFYLWQGRWYIVFILFTTIFTFLLARNIEKITKDTELKGKEKKKKKQLQVGIACVVCFTVLVLFKIPAITSAFSLILPLGISYYTFQSIGYIVDVYREKYPSEKNLFRYALFVGYFPSMLQGPINRFDRMEEQFKAEHTFDFIRIRNGIWLFLWGLFKKLVIADRCAVYVGNVLGENITDYTGSVLLVGLILFVVQMYGDFSGGIDMVEGVSEMFGICMYQNFRQPYFARTIGEYWRRWHMSLSNWIKDYVFYSMALSKPYRNMSKAIKKKNVHLGKTIPSTVLSVITFVMIGLWHEINMNYVLYGLWYGFMLGLAELAAPVFEKISKMTNAKKECFSYRMFERLRTWSIVLVGESFSILPSIAAIGVFWKAVFTDFCGYELFFGIYECGLTGKDFLVLLLSVLIWWLVSYLKECGHSLRTEIGRQNMWFRWGLTVGIIAFVAIFGIYGPGYQSVDFLYGGV